jgi:hypothetical protein
MLYFFHKIFLLKFFLGKNLTLLQNDIISVGAP